MMRATFCLEPGGDSPYRKGVFDALLSGCVPVLFSQQLARVAPWHRGLEALPGVGAFSPHAVVLNASAVARGAAKESEIPNFKGSFLGRFPLVSADFWTSDHLLERPRRVDAFSGTRARGTLTVKRR